MTEQNGPERTSHDDGTNVLKAIDGLRRELSGYHGQLVARNDLERHCERQRETLARMNEAHERDLRQIAALKNECRALWLWLNATCEDADELAGHRRSLSDAGVVV